MLFIGTMAYNLGASALCYQAGFSPVVGSYLAGLSLSLLPSRIQIQNKVGAMCRVLCKTRGKRAARAATRESDER